MSLNPTDLMLGPSVTGGNNGSPPVPFPIMAYGANTTHDISSSADAGTRFPGGENHGNSFQNHGNNFLNHTPVYSVPMNQITMPPSACSVPGTWHVNLKLSIIFHRHADGSFCFDVLGHAVAADSEEQDSFKEARQRLIDHILIPERDRCARIEAENRGLKDENQRLTTRIRELQNRIDSASLSARPAAGNKRKPERDSMSDRRPPPPAKSLIPAPSLHRDISSPPSYDSLGSEPFPRNAVPYLLLQHWNYRPGMAPSPYVTFTELGWPCATPDIEQHARSRTTPSILPLSEFSGESSGNQIPPMNTMEWGTVQRLSKQLGNVVPLMQVRDCKGMFLVLAGLQQQFKSANLSLPPSIQDILVLKSYPEWSHLTCFYDGRDHVQPNDSETNWNPSPSLIPSIRPPSRQSSDHDCALFIAIHYDPRHHMKVFVTDNLIVHLDTIVAHRIFVEMTPNHRRGVWDFRLEFVRLVAWPKLYKDILREKGFVVNPKGHVTMFPHE
ncbi:hypothetical protein PQX77_013407 [Marasmius sp. AFHP31]|nr:hypothetical protein PQX77_013407 [Marasmius sp. AFHP31]